MSVSDPIEALRVSQVFDSLGSTLMRRQRHQHGQPAVQFDQPRMVELVKVPNPADDDRQQLLPFRQLGPGVCSGYTDLPRSGNQSLTSANILQQTNASNDKQFA
jgi:hypothetical protein